MYTVLYTDDEPGLLEIGKAFLESTGRFTVHTAISASDALELIGDMPVDCIVADYQMPVMDGIAFLKDLRGSGNDVPFILFTGRGREEVVIEALNNGADYYLQKGGAPSAQFAELAHKIRLAVENRRTHTALRESEETYRRILENLQDAYIRVDAEGIVRMVNPSAVRMYGYGSADEMIGLPAASLYVEQEKGRAEALRRVMEAEGVVDLSGMSPRKDGSTFAASLNIQLIRDETGRIIGTEAIVRDISDRRKREDELRAAYEQISAAEEELRAQYDEAVRGEQIVRESRERLQSFMDSATDAFTIYDGNLNIIDLNRAALSYLPPGTKKEDITGRNLSEFIGGTDEWGDLGRFREVIRTGIPFSADRKAFDSGSGRRWVNVKVFRVGTGLGLMTTDVTQQRDAEERLNLLKISVDEAYDEVFWMDFDGNFLYVNDAACRNTGYTQEEFSKMKISTLNPETLPDWWEQSVADLRVRKRQYLTTRHRKKDGTIYDVEIMAVYVNKDGMEYSFAFVRDITERKQAEEKLREDERKFRHILENMQDAYLRTDVNGIITMVNPSAARLFGYGSPEEMAGLNAEVLYLRPEDRVELLRILKEAGGITNFSGNSVRKDKSTFPVSLNVQIIRDENGNITGTEAIVRDMSG